MQKKAWSRSTSIDHNRSVSICSIPMGSGFTENADTEEDYEITRNKYIEQILDDKKVSVDVSFSNSLNDSLNPTHFKAFSEDLAKQSMRENLDTRLKERSHAASIWTTTSNKYPLFFYPPNKCTEKMEVVAEQLNENLQLDDESDFEYNH